MTSAPDNLASLVDDMLQDAGCAQEAELRDALFSLGALASLPAPAPTGELAALLGPGVPSQVEDPVPAEQPDGPAAEQPGEQPDQQHGGLPADELARRRRRHRPTALGLVLVAGMGLGVGGVAASSTPSGNSAVEHLMEDWTPWSGPASEPSAAGYGYRAPKVASDVELGTAGSLGAPGGSADGASLASRLLRDPAGPSRQAGYGQTGTPACAGPVKHDAAGTCTPAGTGAAPQGSGAGKEDTVSAEGPLAGEGAAGTAKAGQTASSTPPAAADAAGAAQKAAGTAANASPAPAQGAAGSQGVGQGNGAKSPSPGK